MIPAKTQLLDSLDHVRQDLWHTLDELDNQVEIYPGWKKREFLAHIAGWEAMVFDVIRSHLSGKPLQDHMYTGIDSANARFVSVRERTTLLDAKLECEINRFAILRLLEEIEDYDEVIQFPWGPNTVTEFLHGAIEHEQIHLNDIIALKSHLSG